MSRLEKVFCDFCGKEIAAARAGKTWHTITWHGCVTEMQRDVCNECFDERLVAIKDDKPIIELQADFAFEKIAHWFGCPCDWSFDDIGDVDDYMFGHCCDWCEENCEKNDAKACWKKLFEAMANEKDNERI